MEKKTKRALIGVLCGIPIVAGGVAAIFLSKNCSPDVQQCTVNFAVKDADKEVAYVSKSHISVEKGTTFKEIKSQSSAYKTVDNKDYPFQYWEDASGTMVQDTFKVDKDLTVFANFKEPADNTILISFTVDPEDSEGVVIGIPFKEIDKGTATFAKVVKDVEDSTTRVTEEGTWKLDHWYRDGYPKESSMDPNLFLTETLEVHPYFIPPETITHKVQFVAGDSGANIISETGETSFEVKHGTTLGDLISQSHIKAIKDDYAFQWWTVNLHPERGEGQEWIPPDEAKDDYEITEDLILYPYLVENTPVYTPKTIIWEKTDEGQPYSSNFNLTDTQYTFGTSRFLLMQEDEITPTVLQEGETIELYDVSATGHPDLISGTMVNHDDQMNNRINVRFNIDQTLVDSVRGQNVPFTVTFLIHSNGQTKTCTFNLSFNIETIFEPATVTYNATSKTALVTEPGIKDYTFESDKRSPSEGQFIVSRKLADDESIEPVISSNLENPEDVSNIVVNNIRVVENNNIQYLNFSIAFKQITGLGYTHISNFDLSFDVVRNETDSRTHSEGNKNFSLTFTPVKGAPYAVAMNKTYIFESASTELPIEIQVERDPDWEGGKLPGETPRFWMGHFMDIENSISTPLHFAVPSDGYQGGPKTRLEGDDTNKAKIKACLDFGPNPGSVPTAWTAYEANLTFSFWDDKEALTEDHLINHYPLPTKVTFYYDPVNTANLNYTNDSWAQTQSLGIIQKATNNVTGNEEISIGTSWVIATRQQEGFEYFEYAIATSYDIKKDHYTLSNTDNYTNYKIGFFTPESGEECVKNDSTKYITLDDESTNVYYVNLADYGNDINWDEPDLTWTGSGIGPDMCVLKVKLNSSHNLDENSQLAFRFHFPMKKYWWDLWGNKIAQVQIPLVSGFYDRYSRVMFGEEMLPFDKGYFAYGYVGGFKSTNITTIGGKNKLAVYWKGFQMNMGRGDLDLIGTTTYSLFSNRDGMSLGTGIKNRCPAFVLIDNAFKKKDYLDAAGRGALFMLRPRGDTSGSLDLPMIAGINTWDGVRYGKSNFNWPSHVTPYFDCFVYDTTRYDSVGYNLLNRYKTPW